MAYTHEEVQSYNKIRTNILGSKIAFGLVVGAALVGLKLTGSLHLSWPWVTAPLSWAGIQFLGGVTSLATLAFVGRN